MPTVKDIIVRKPSEEEARTCKTWGTWECEVSTFPWEYTQTEKCLILTGRVTVTNDPDDGASVSFGPGDYVEFPDGLRCLWKVAEPVRKHYEFE